MAGGDWLRGNKGRLRRKKGMLERAGEPSMSHLPRRLLVPRGGESRNRMRDLLLGAAESSR